ncbi:chromosome segregation ATPase [Herbinix hemicellulosilytica]|uniref:Uncharacterized protein n=1 Tax=Herbinix hemicellulosilytica TaxID=1564487 RepID=A0A0H5SIH4_HERHM|nr:hypothetical protein [Herbinix hemicellulosilytica]RBP60891.1 chromosome segregation ATPase [Herbinix hemicellulosilytica]CRZ34586.1 hypothetical protein HHT355_1385 [Herbinix hemicellulosilytica]
MSTIGTKIVLEGEKEYRQAINQVNNSINVLKSELKAVSAEFEGNANSIDALRAKHEILVKEQAEQEKKIKLIKAALEEAAKQYGENSKQVQDWQIKLNNASAYLIKLNREIEDNEKYMKEAEEATDKTAKSIDEYGRRINDAAQKTSLFGDILKANLLSNAISDGIRKMANLLGDSIEKSIELASDLEEVQNVVDVTFGQKASVIDKWAESMGEAHGVSVLLSKQFVGTMGAMLKSMQLTDKEVIEMSKNLVQLAGDMASFYNLDVEEAFAKIRSGISGETEPLKQLGINLNVANLEAYALANGIKKAYSEMTQAEQATLRYNYLMQVTADAQGDFARNIGSLANQQRIQALQQEEILMKLGNAIIPAVTKATSKLNEAMDGMGDQMAEVAEVLSEGVVDAFVWLIDNSDKVIAGLKGIGAAILVKKAADGVLYVVEAYKTLKTATEAATVAQTAFNNASKANIYIAIASAILGAATAIDSYIRSMRKATDEITEMDEETRRLIDSSERLKKEIENRANAWEEERRSIEANYGAAKELSYRLYELADKEQKTNAEKQEMVSLVEQLNKLIPDLNIVIDEQTWVLSKQKNEVEALISKYKEYALTKTAEDKYTDLLRSRIDAEIQLNNLIKEREQLEQELDYENLREKYSRYVELRSRAYISLSKEEKQFLKENANLRDEFVKASDRLAPYINQIKELEKELSKLSDATKSVEEFISESFKSSSTYLDEFSTKYKKYLDEQTQAEIGTLEDRKKKLNKIYEAASNDLEKQLRSEERAFTKSWERRINDVQEAQEKELKALEKAHKEKLKLIDKEYTERIKLVDEDRYRELKRIQEQIDAIDAQQEAEDRALKERENAEKKAEIQARIETAKTSEERLEAIRELQRFEEQLARERLKEERKLQKSILEEQKETINKSYDKKIESIKEEQRAEQEKLNEQYEAEKEAIRRRYQLRIEALKEEQELERDTLREKQAEYRTYLKEQKDLALQNAEEIYQEDLAKFKMYQALKYKEATSSEEQMKKAIQEYAYKYLPPGQTRDTLLRSNDLSEMLKYYNPTAMLKSSVAQTTVSIDYNMIEIAMTNALKKLNLTVQLDKRAIGQIVDTRIYQNIKGR